jgi:DEAD/DEAH box helicase domain-containing protein
MRLFENLRYIVLDEVHTYRAVFGSHLANGLRRLRRFARFYGSESTVHRLFSYDCKSGELASQRVKLLFLRAY